MIACTACAALALVPSIKPGSKYRCGGYRTLLFDGVPITLIRSNISKHASESTLPLHACYWASYCLPSQQMAPGLAETASQLEPRMRLGTLDTEAEPALARRYQVRAMPTLILIVNGGGSCPAIRRDACERYHRLDTAGCARLARVR